MAARQDPGRWAQGDHLLLGNTPIGLAAESWRRGSHPAPLTPLHSYTLTGDSHWLPSGTENSSFPGQTLSQSAGGNICGCAGLHEAHSLPWSQDRGSGHEYHLHFADETLWMRAVKQLAQGHRARHWQSWNSNPNLPMPGPVLVAFLN